MSGPTARYRCALCLLAALLGAADALGQNAQRPSSSRRTVAAFDFEEPDNPFQVPADFFRAQSDPSNGIDRPGYPVYNLAAFSEEHARSGTQSVLLPIERGSVALRLRPGAIPIFHDADYHIACHVRGADITHARFRLIGRLLDQNAEPIPGGEVTSEPVQPDDAWRIVEIAVPGGIHDQAAFLQIDAELVQPEHYAEHALGEHQVWPEDFTGRAWVDDIVVSQLPRIWLRTSTPGGIIAEPAEPELRFLVRDLTGERLSARIRVTDAHGNQVFTDTMPIRSSAIPQRWPIELPKRGWYHAELDILAGERTVGTADCALARVAPTTALTDAEGGSLRADLSRFELGVNVWNDHVLDAMPHIGRSTATHGISVAGWTSSLTEDNLEARTQRILQLFGSSEHQWADPAVALHNVPRGLSSQHVLDNADIIDALQVEYESRAVYLDDMLDVLGQIATRWRLGAIDPIPDFALLEGNLASIRRELSSLVPGPRVGLVLPVPLAFPDWHTEHIDEVTVRLPPGTGAHLAGDAVERWVDSPLAGAARLTLSYGIEHDSTYVADAVAVELVKRMILAEAAATDTQIRLAHQIADVWTISDRDGIISPFPAVPAWRATIDRLAGRTVAAELIVGQGVRAFLLIPTDPDDPRGGALVAWNESAPDDHAWVRTNLGAGELTRIDLWGNPAGSVETVMLESEAGHEIRLHEIHVGRQPIFVEGIDVELAMFVASIRIDEPRIQTTSGPHTRNVLITNPWRVAIDGDVIILEPAERLPSGRRTGWDVSPRVSRFSVGPGETTAVPVELSFSAVELAGTKPFVVDVAIRSGPIQDRLRAPSAIELALDGIELDARTIVDRTGANVALEAVITNVSSDPADLVLHAATRGYPRQSASITQLAPGASTVRRFIYPDGVTRLSGVDIYVGVEDPVRRGRLNKRVSVD